MNNISILFFKFTTLSLLFLVGCDGRVSENLSSVERHESEVIALQSAQEKLADSKKRSLELRGIEMALLSELKESGAEPPRIAFGLTSDEIKVRIQEAKKEKAKQEKINVERKLELNKLKAELELKQQVKS